MNADTTMGEGALQSNEIRTSSNLSEGMEMASIAACCVQLGLVRYNVRRYANAYAVTFTVGNTLDRDSIAVIGHKFTTDDIRYTLAKAAGIEMKRKPKPAREHQSMEKGSEIVTKAEVTAEMIEAGQKAFEAWYPKGAAAYEDTWSSLAVRDIFWAMRAKELGSVICDCSAEANKPSG